MRIIFVLLFCFGFGTILCVPIGDIGRVACGRWGILAGADSDSCLIWDGSFATGVPESFELVDL